MILVIIFILLSSYIPVNEINQNIKTYLQGEDNKEPIINLNSTLLNSSNHKLKTYDKDGIFFYYPKYWTPDTLQETLSFQKKHILNRWDDGVHFYITDKSIENVLKEKQNERYKNPQKIKVDEKDAYKLSTTKADYYQLLFIIEKDDKHSYVFIFYTDRDLKKQNTKLFEDIIENMKLK